MKKLIALLMAFALLSTTAFAYYYAPYGSSTSEYSHTKSSESITVSENEHARTTYSSSNYWRPGNYRATETYDYGRSREFSFSKEYENTYERKSDLRAYPYITGTYDYNRFAYPYYPDSQYSDYYDYSYDLQPYSNSRFANYYGYAW